MYAAAVLVTAMMADVVPTPYDILVADSVLREPPNVPPPAPWPRGRNAFLFVLVREEAIDPECMSSMFPASGIWDNEVNYARRNIAVVKDAPRLYHLARFPAWDVATQLHELNRDHAERLKERLAWEPDRRDRLAPAVAESLRLARLWKMVAEVQTVRNWDCPRRLRLAQLRTYMGAELWDSHEPIPVAAAWSFESR